jgi:hypothetical protein
MVFPEQSRGFGILGFPGMARYQFTDVALWEERGSNIGVKFCEGSPPRGLPASIRALGRDAMRGKGFEPSNSYENGS